MEFINYLIIFIYSYVLPPTSESTSNYVKLQGSSLNHLNNFAKVGELNPATVLTLTIVTGSMSNTQLVADYYRTVEGLTVFDETNMHLKISGSVAVLSKEFNTSFNEYECDRKDVCFATNSDISIPQSLQSKVIGVLGLENMMTLKPH